MIVGVAHSELNPNSSWLGARGGWVSYSLGVLVLHMVVRSVPFLRGPCVWTATNVLHNIIMYVVLHVLKGAPWLTSDQGESRRLTHWEQIDSGKQFTQTKKFLTVFPVILACCWLVRRQKKTCQCCDIFSIESANFSNWDIDLLTGYWLDAVDWQPWNTPDVEMEKAIRLTMGSLQVADELVDSCSCHVL